MRLLPPPKGSGFPPQSIFMNYKENAKRLSDAGDSIEDLCTICDVPLNRIPKSIREELDCDFDSDENCTVALNQCDIDKYELWYDVSYSELDENELESLLDGIIKKAEHYLVFAYGIRWDGADGYTFCDSPVNIMHRSYECSHYIRKASAGGKVLEFIESSHDVPMGALCYAIALTDGEYDRLSNADWKTVEAFAKKHEF